jgi:hypothetical protein
LTADDNGASEALTTSGALFGRHESSEQAVGAREEDGERVWPGRLSRGTSIALLEANREPVARAPYSSNRMQGLQTALALRAKEAGTPPATLNFDLLIGADGSGSKVSFSRSLATC